MECAEDEKIGESINGADDVKDEEFADSEIGCAGTIGPERWLSSLQPMWVMGNKRAAHLVSNK